MIRELASPSSNSMSTGSIRRAVAGQRDSRPLDARLEASPRVGGSAEASRFRTQPSRHTFRALLSGTLRRSLDGVVPVRCSLLAGTEISSGALAGGGLWAPWG